MSPRGFWSAASSFTTRGCVALGSPTLSSPANGATGVSSSAALDWTDVTSATGYEVQLASDSAFTNVVASNTALTDSAWTVSPALLRSAPARPALLGVRVSLEWNLGELLHAEPP